MALEEGYRLFDTAYSYNNEEAIGRALKRWVDTGKCHREELFITTKVKQSNGYKNIRHSANIIKLYKNIIKLSWLFNSVMMFQNMNDGLDEGMWPVRLYAPV